MTYYPRYESAFEQRFRRYRLDCHRGRTHKLDEHQTRKLWADGETKTLVLCWWCQTWVVSRNVNDDMLDTWSPAAKAYWKERHP